MRAPTRESFEEIYVNFERLSRNAGVDASGYQNYGYNDVALIPLEYIDQLLHPWTGRGLYAYSLLSGVEAAYQFYRDDISVPYDVAFKLMPGLDEGAFVIRDAVGINAASEQSELAAAFVKMLYLAEYESTDDAYSSFSVYPSVADRKVRLYVETYLSEYENSADSFDYAAFSSLYQNLKTPEKVDIYVLEVLFKAALRCYGGDISLDEMYDFAAEQLKGYNIN